MRLFSYVLLASLFIAAPALAQNQYGDLYYFVNADDIRGIAQDGNILWVATFGGGLVKFDKTTRQKSNFLRTNSGLTTHLLTSIAMGPDHTIWMGTNTKGIISFDGKNWKSHTYLSERLPNDGIRALVFDKKGRLWAGTDNGLTYRDSGKWKTFAPYNSSAPSAYAFSLALDSTGKVWAGFIDDHASAGTVGFVENDSLHIINDQNSNSPLREVTYDHIAVDATGGIWFGAGFSTLYTLKNNTWKSYDVTIGKSPNIIYDVSGVYSLAADAKGGMWVLTQFALLHYDSVGMTPQAIRVDSTPQMPQGYGAMKVDGGLLWRGTTPGLSRFDMTNWQTTDLSNCALTGNTVPSVKLARSGAIWVNNSFSICRFDQGNWNTVDYKLQTQPKYSLQGEGQQDIVLDGDSLKWILFGYNGCVEYGNPYSTQFFAIADTDEALGIYKGLIHNGQSYFVTQHAYQWTAKTFDGAHFKKMIQPKDSPAFVINVNDLAVDRFNTLWFGEEYFGVVKYDGNRWTLYNPLISKLPFGSMRQIEFDSLGYWYGASDSGLVTYFGDDHWQASPIDPDRDYINNLASLAVGSDRSIFTLSKNGTLSHYDGVSWEILDTSKLPLPELQVNNCLLDTKGNLWIATQFEGIAVYHKNGVKLGVSQPGNHDEQQSACSVYPNPVSDKARVSTGDNTDQIKEVTLIDILGRTALVVHSPAGNGIDMMELPAGYYTLLCTMQSGKILTSRIVKR